MVTRCSISEVALLSCYSSAALLPISCECTRLQESPPVSVIVKSAAMDPPPYHSVPLTLRPNRYALKRHLLKFEGGAITMFIGLKCHPPPPTFAPSLLLLLLLAIFPAESQILGYFRGEPIYSRDCVHVVRNQPIATRPPPFPPSSFSCTLGRHG